MIKRIIPIHTQNDSENKQFYEYLYTKNSGFGFTEQQDLDILKKLYPEARQIKVIYSVPGEAYFVLTH